MPMCKGCKEVFGVSDIQDGFCKECYTPELAVRERERQEQNKIDRPLSITVISILGIILYGLPVFSKLIVGGMIAFTESHYISGTEILIILGIIGLSGFLMAAYMALYKMKKWGAYGVIALQIFSILYGLWLMINAFKQKNLEALGFIWLSLFISIVFIWVIVVNLKKMK
jgi:hypothetical protein